MCEAYKKIAASRSKKKSPSKKEKEVFIKTLIPRIIEILANSLCSTSLPVPGCLESNQGQRSHSEAAGGDLRGERRLVNSNLYLPRVLKMPIVNKILKNCAI